MQTAWPVAGFANLSPEASPFPASGKRPDQALGSSHPQMLAVFMDSEVKVLSVDMRRCRALTTGQLARLLFLPSPRTYRFLGNRSTIVRDLSQFLAAQEGISLPYYIEYRSPTGKHSVNVIRQ